jgi:ATP-dependent exoDNAse (exonuclease V) alpha subunit
MTATATQPPYQITSELKEILDLLDNQPPPVLFVTGSAGTGKSTLIQIIRQQLRKNIAVVAPTGVAALRVGGQTIHTFFRFPAKPQPSAKRLHGESRRIIDGMDILVIDEVSMVRADLLDAIDASLRRNTESGNMPFGGKTVLLVGDLHQLPPVIATDEEKRLFQEHYDSPFFFSAKCFGDIQLVTKNLSKSFRQTDNTFIELLNNIRVGRNLSESAQILNNTNECMRKEAMLILTTVNAKARQYNEKQLGSLDQKEWCFEAELEGDWSERDDQLPAPRSLRLKKNAQVMFVKNGPEWVNGTVGRVVDLNDESIEVELLSEPNKGTTVGVKRESWDRYQYKWNDKRRMIDIRTIGSYRQLPFILAWAVTIHKAQGLTLDEVNIDLGRGAFAPGQTYVALSRCRTMDGISFSRPLEIKDMLCDQRIIDFYSNVR